MLSALPSFVYLPSSNVEPLRGAATTRNSSREWGGALGWRLSVKQETKHPILCDTLWLFD